jgi:hypothetical protein
MSRAALSRADIVVGLAALALALLHAGAHVLAGRPHDVLWICNVAALLVGPAVLLRSPTLSAVCLTWLPPGTLVWLLDVILAGSSILPTSYGAHLGGTAASIYAVRRNGHAPRGFLASLGVLAAVLLASRIALPPHTNVNSMRAVPPGWEFLGDAWAVFAAASIACGVGIALAGHLLGRAIAPRRTAS